VRAERLENQDIPGVPTANWGHNYGETCLEIELKKSRVPLGCVSFLVLVVVLNSLFSGGGGGGSALHVPAASPAPPTPSPPPAPEPEPELPAQEPEPEPPADLFPSCTGRKMDCHGAEACGVVVLETGKGQGDYQHSTPSVHGLWPQNGQYGTSACVPPKTLQNFSGTAYLPPCYDNHEAQKNPAHQESFVMHEWEKHGACSGALDEMG
jgi:hypothetical protein